MYLYVCNERCMQQTAILEPTCVIIMQLMHTVSPILISQEYCGQSTALILGNPSLTLRHLEQKQNFWDFAGTAGHHTAPIRT